MKKILTSKINTETEREEAVYDKELILDGVTAFRAMKEWMSIYFKDNYDTELGELLGNICFTYSGFVDRTECWDLWEKVVKEIVEQNAEIKSKHK